MPPCIVRGRWGDTMRFVFRGLAVAIAFGLILGGGSQAATRKTVKAPFSEADYAWSQASGKNSIAGAAVLRTVGGEARTCASFEVELSPKGPYSSERMILTYGSLEKGFAEKDPTIDLAPEPPEFRWLVRKTTCDGAGNFSFDGVPDGTYFIVTKVHWDVVVPGLFGPTFARQGAWLMQRITVEGGKTTKVVLTR